MKLEYKIIFLSFLTTLICFIQFYTNCCTANTDIKDYLISSLLFCPEKVLKERPLDFGLKYNDIHIPLENGNSLYGWYIPANKKTKKHIIYFHGSKGNLSLYLGGIKELHKVGENILIVDYEGFGLSSGNPTIKNTINDGFAIYDFLLNYKHLKPEDISLFGYSYGGAIAIKVALKRKVYAILVESTFSSLNEIAVSKYSPLVSFIVSKHLLNTLSNIKQIDVPVIVAYAEKDQIIPTTHSINIYKNANSPKYLFKIKNAQHHNIFKFVSPNYIELIKSVFD